MIEALEKLLRDLEEDFQNLEIAFTKGQEFDMTEFALSNFNDSKVAFYDPEHCDGINNNPELKTTIEQSEINWVDASTHEYPKNVGRALYNSTLRALWMAKNPGSAAPGIKTHKEYIDTNHLYMDNQKVETRGPAGNGVSSTALTRTPLIVDPTTETFGKSYQKFLDVMAKDTDPFRDTKANCWVPGAASMMDASTPKTIAGFQTSLHVLNERLAIYHARKNENLLNEDNFIAASTAATEKTKELTQSLREIENKYNPFFDTARQVEHNINSTNLSEMNSKQKEQFIKETIAQLEAMKKNSITQEAIQHDIDTLTNQYRTLSNNNTVALPHTPGYQSGLYQGIDISLSFHSAENDAIQQLQGSIAKLNHYKNTHAQIVAKQETQLKKLQGDLIESAAQLINKVESIKFAVTQLNDLIHNEKRLRIGSKSFDEIAKRITWDDEITQLAQLKSRLIRAESQLSSQEANQPIDEALFKELSQILAWNPQEIEQWGYITKPAGYAESGTKLFWSALNSLALSEQPKSRQQLLQDEIKARLKNVSIDPNRKKTNLETMEATTQSELTAVEDSLSLINKYFGENGEAVNYLKNREKEFAFFDNLQAMTKIFRRTPTEKEKRRNFIAEIGTLVKNYENDRNPEHLRLALKKINALKITEQFKSRSEYKKSMRAVLNKLSGDINGILVKNDLHTQYFHPEHGKVGVFLDILRKNDHWKYSNALSEIETINASMKAYGHDQDLKRTDNTLKLVNNLLDHWTEYAPTGASHVNQMKHTLESLKDALEKNVLYNKYFGTEGVIEQSIKQSANDSNEPKLQRINYLFSIGELMEQHAQDKNPQHLVKIHEKIDAVIKEGSTLFADDRAKGQHSIQTILAGLKEELSQSNNARANIAHEERGVAVAPVSNSSRMVMSN